MSHPKYRADIDGLRAVAVLSVVGFHAFPTYIPGGFIGVDIFFVISGYLISSIIFDGLQKESFSFSDFYSRRVKRIFPALIVVMTASFVFGWNALLPEEFKQLGKHIAGGASFASNFVLWNESSYFDNVAQTKPLLHLWSLGIEEQFYIIWPLFLWCAWKMRFNPLLLILLLGSLSFCLNIYSVGSNPAATFYSPWTRFWELLAGSFLAWVKVREFGVSSKFVCWIYRAQKKCPLSILHLQNMIALTGGLLVLLGFIVISEHKPFPGWRALFPVVGTALLISGGGTWLNKVVLSNRILVWFGLISFPLYLWHWPLLSYMRIVNGASSGGVRLAAVFLSVGLAWLTFRFVEIPIRYGAGGRFKTFFLSVVLMTAGGVGFATYREDGLKSRPAIKKLAEATNSLTWPSENNFDKVCPTRFPKSGYCKISADAEATVALIGDSQANHFFPGLSEQYQKIGENLVNLGCGACPPVVDVVSRYSGKEANGIGTMDLVFKMVSESPSIQTVILAGNWHLYMNGTRFSDESKSWPLWEIRTQSQPTLSSNEEVFDLQMSKTISLLKKAGKQIVVIKQIPELNYLPSICLPPRPFAISKQQSLCETPVAKVENYLNQYEKKFDSFFAQYPDIAVWDPKASLCDTTSCFSVKGGVSLYRDELHLSEYGSKVFAKTISKSFR